MAAGSGAIASEFVGEWFDEDSFSANQVASALARHVTTELLAKYEPYPSMGRLFDPSLRQVTKIVSVGADLEYVFSRGRGDRFSTAGFLGYSRLKNAFHVFADGVSRMALHRWVQPCNNPACKEKHFLLSNEFLTQECPQLIGTDGTILTDEAFVVDFCGMLALLEAQASNMKFDGPH